MRVKKYSAATMPEVMKQVRKELGDSAVILNSKEKRTKGILGLFRKKNIEVLAAVDPNPVNLRQTQKTNNNLTKNMLIQEQDQTATGTKQNNNVNEELVNEIKQLKEQLSSDSQPNYPTVIQETVKKLESQGVNRLLRDQLADYLLEEYYTNDKSKDIEHFKKVTQEFLKGKLEQATNFKPDLQTKNIYLFGPTGVGKTTTVAKLAAEAAIVQHKNVGLITLDTYRIAAVEQLKTYGKILNIPVEVAYNREDFEAAKQKFSEKDIIFIDSAGRNFRKTEYIDQVKELIHFEDHDELYGVLALTGKEQDLDEIYGQFTQLPINKVIFTKADETSQYGMIYNLWNKYRFSIAYITYGQDVPEDIQKASPEVLSEMIVGETQW
ncbi:flagellar biosynthesis protein FlhF [Alkalibacillus aidingensis]|uniref:flagellar biosynthesis protein FlhF n=1 Tax=Alkalibacillus aidingensis TaxID=2747607 RepID=UPI001660B01F|nr:flagellar biosynthesis protein FlhF [Alkalibacillus aidingensis]